MHESLAICKQHMPKNPFRYHVESLLGTALVGQKKFEEAEPFARDGYLVPKSNNAPLPPETVRIVAALDRLIALYEAWGKADETAKWRKERDSLQAKK